MSFVNKNVAKALTIMGGIVLVLSIIGFISMFTLEAESGNILTNLVLINLITEVMSIFTGILFIATGNMMNMVIKMREELDTNNFQIKNLLKLKDEVDKIKSETKRNKVEE